MDPTLLRVGVRVKVRVGLTPCQVNISLTLTLAVTITLTWLTTSVELCPPWHIPPEDLLQIFEMDFLSKLLKRTMLG